MGLLRAEAQKTCLSLICTTQHWVPNCLWKQRQHRICLSGASWSGVPSVEAPQMRNGRTILLSELHKNIKHFKVILFRWNYTKYIDVSPNNWLKHTVLQWRCTVASTSLCRVVPWCSRGTASFRPPLGTLKSIQNLGGSWFSPTSIDLHSNYDNFWRTSPNLSELLQHELLCCPPNQRIRVLI